MASIYQIIYFDLVRLNCYPQMAFGMLLIDKLYSLMTKYRIFRYIFSLLFVKETYNKESQHKF